MLDIWMGFDRGCIITEVVFFFTLQKEFLRRAGSNCTSEWLESGEIKKDKVTETGDGLQKESKLEGDTYLYSCSIRHLVLPGPPGGLSVSERPSVARPADESSSHNYIARLNVSW